MILDELFTGARLPPEDPSNGWYPFLKTLLEPITKRAVTKNNAHLFDDVYSVVNVLSDDVAKLPLKVYQKTEGKIEKLNRSAHPLVKLLRTRPNRYMNISDYTKLMMIDVLLSGNHYSLISIDEKGDVKELIPLSANFQPVIEKGELFYQGEVRGKTRTFLADEILHIKGFTRDGIRGISPIAVLAERIQGNDLAVSFNNNFMQNAGTPNSILKVSGQISKEAKDAVRQEWKRANSKEAVAVIDSGLDYQQIGISQTDMQFIESQKFNLQKIAALYKVPMHKINELSRATYANIEHQALEYVKGTLQPWLTRIEVEMNTKLFTEKEQDEEFYVKFNIDSELRGDSKTRAEVHRMHVESGQRTIDEVRADDEMPPFEAEWSKEPLITLNVTPASMMKAYQAGKAGLNQTQKGEKDGN